MISGCPHIGGTTRNKLKHYAKALDYDGEISKVNQHIAQRPRLMDQPITFTEEDAKLVCFPHHELLADRELSPSSSQLTGFNGTTLVPMGKVRLPITLCPDTPQRVTTASSSSQDELDPRIGSKTTLEPMEDIEEVRICDEDPTKVKGLGKGLDLEE
uniref:Uncharacterized protein n=1 Tax=Cannabis sativa TaxID=3483 RepID=A0A803QDX2_CANSA